ncbi:MAG: sulfatase-like hydrolase/transferase [Oligoflexia bacterium]|nr:sulfatase-like hydrolase/transferase [Oligoflexia bacterium]
MLDNASDALPRTEAFLPVPARAKLQAALRYLATYLIFPNLIFLVLGHFFYLMRPLVNIDYLLIGAIAPFVGPWVSAALYAATLANEFFINVAPVYRFEIADAIAWISQLQYVNWKVWAPSISALLAASVIGSAFAIRISSPSKLPKFENRRWVSIGFLALTFFVSAADISNGTSFVPFPVHLSYANFNIAYSGIRRTVMAAISVPAEDKPITYQALPTSGSATGPLWSQLRVTPPGAPLPQKQISLTLVESMGLFRDPALRDRLLAPLEDPKLLAKYDVRIGTAPFRGFTLNGEFRELCAIQVTRFGEHAIPSCLPRLLHERGYETIAFHGFTNLFYNRYQWYPQLGFDRIFFAQDMQQIGVSQKCGSGFRGLCDTAVADAIHRTLLAGSAKHPQFVYWMTLNSHLPMDSVTGSDSPFDCGASPATTPGTGVCRSSRIIYQVLAKLAEIALDPKLPPTEFIVAGDHAPPFDSPKTRALYSDSDIPTITLTPKTNEP